MTQKIQAVIFDMDGVLVDSEPLLSTAAIAMFQEKGLAVQPEDFLPFVGAGEDRYIGGVAEKYHFPLDVSRAKKRTYEIYLELVPTQLEAFPGVHALVHTCRQAGLPVAIASGTDKIKVTASLHKIGLPEKVWDTVVTGNDITRNKPAPDIFLAAAHNLGVPPAACVVIEDSVNGIRAAKAAGMRCVAVAQTFPVGRLQEADVVRDRVLDVRLSDLAPDLSIDL
jgi:beta-phosphoglucomutase